MGGPYLKTPFLATRGPKMKKRRAHCFLELLKIKRWTKKKNSFSTFFRQSVSGGGGSVGGGWGGRMEKLIARAVTFFVS